MQHRLYLVSLWNNHLVSMPVRGAVTENTDSSDASVAEAFGWVDLSLQVLFIDMSN